MAEHKVSLGHITMVPKGTYSPSETYNRLDLVRKVENNKVTGIYISKIDDNKNHSLTDNTYWMKLIDAANDLVGPAGNGIASITGPTNPGVAGVIDTYTINYTDGTKSTFQVTNGTNGQDGQDAVSPNFDTPTVNTLSPGSQASVSITPIGPSTNNTYHLTFGIPKGDTGIAESGGGSSGGATTWGSITGSISNQTDLQDALNSKADSSNLGTMAAINDAPSDNKTYGRNNAGWVEIINSGGGSGGVGVTNPLTFSDYNDTMKLGIFESASEGNIELRGEKGGSNTPAIYVTQYNGNTELKRLTLLNTSGITVIPDLQITNSIELNQPLPVEQGGTAATGPGIDLLDNLGIHVTNTEPDENTSLTTGHILLVYED